MLSQGTCSQRRARVRAGRGDSARQSPGVQKQSCVASQWLALLRETRPPMSVVYSVTQVGSTAGQMTAQTSQSILSHY